MKKIMSWVFFITLVVFVIDWTIMGLKIFDNDYNITPEAYIGFACILILLVCAVYKIFSSKCPYCKKPRLTNGKYCSYCGKEI